MDEQARRDGRGGDAPETAPDVTLAAMLGGFARHAGAADSEPSPVSVTLVRRARFTNVATTPSGLQVVLDEPADFGGTGEAPDPAEFLLAALGASLSVTLTAHAALRGLPIAGIEMAVAGEIDGRSFFAPRLFPHAGVLATTVDLTLSAPITAREAKGLLAEALRACPVLRSLKPRPRVRLTLKRPD